MRIAWSVAFAASLLLAGASLAHAAAPKAGAIDLASVSLPIEPGATVESVLAALNAKGFRIVYSSALVRPDMRLLEAPQTTRIDDLLREILTPWKLRAVRAANGDWLIVAGDTVANELPVERDAPVVETIETIDVTASRYGIASAGSSATFLDRQDVERMPHLADDAVRMLKVLPGVAGGDFSAALNIRGGRRDEALLTIDGAEIHNGFHFRDLDGALSVLDTNLVEGIDFITGGMTSEYGDYMSGVVDLQTRQPAEGDDYRSAVGVSFVSLYGRTGGTFADGRGSWLASARRGYLDVLMERVQGDDEQFTPRYNDVFAAVSYEFNDHTRLAVRTLLGDDDLRLVSYDEDDVDSAGKGKSGHLWATLVHDWGDDLHMDTLVAYASVEQSRDSEGDERERSGDVQSDFDFRFFDLKQDWSWTGSDRHLPRWGFNYNQTKADYDYDLAGLIRYPPWLGGDVDISRSTHLDLEGSRLGVYASWRTRFGDAITAEVGGRWDSYRYPDSLGFEVVSPRVNLVYAIGERDEARFALSVVHQPQGIDQLQVEDDVTEFFRPERSRQVVLGYTHRFAQGISARVDIYDKDYSNLRPRFENALDSMQLIPEGAVDRVRIDAPEASAIGIEITVRLEAARGFSGWASVAIAKARDREADGDVPRSWEQRHSLSFGTSWTGTNWNLSLGGLYHSGYPTTDIGMRTVDAPGGGLMPIVFTGPRNADNFGDYMRLDLRANRDVKLANSLLSLYFEVTNLLDRENPCCIEDIEPSTSSGGAPRLAVEQSYWLPMLPSLGFQWQF